MSVESILYSYRSDHGDDLQLISILIHMGMGPVHFFGGIHTFPPVLPAGGGGGGGLVHSSLAHAPEIVHCKNWSVKMTPVLC